MSDTTPEETTQLPVDALDFDPRLYLRDGVKSPLLLLAIDGQRSERHATLLRAATAVISEAREEATLDVAPLESAGELRACLPPPNESRAVVNAMEEAGWRVDRGAATRFDDASARLVVFLRPRPGSLTEREWKNAPRGCARRFLQRLAVRAFPELRSKLERRVDHAPKPWQWLDVPLFAWNWPEDREIRSLRMRKIRRSKHAVVKDAAGSGWNHRSSRGQKRARVDDDDDDASNIVVTMVNDIVTARRDDALPSRPPKRARDTSSSAATDDRSSSSSSSNSNSASAYTYRDPLSHERLPVLRLTTDLADPAAAEAVRQVRDALRALTHRLPRVCLAVHDASASRMASPVREFLGTEREAEFSTRLVADDRTRRVGTHHPRRSRSRDHR